jgi:hypothetical protein
LGYAASLEFHTVALPEYRASSGKVTPRKRNSSEVVLSIKPKSFDQDMLALEKAFFKNLQRGTWEYGGIGVDHKRPFGNSDVEGDILELIGAEKEGDDGEEACWSSGQRKYAASLYDNLIEWLQEKYA